MTLTISPGSKSRTNFAPTTSNAHVSDENTYAPLGNWPIETGRKPYLSLATYKAFSIKIKKANAPSSLFKELQIRSIIWPSSRIIKWPKISVSEELEKMLPFFSKSAFKTLALTIFPLCAIPKDPFKVLNNNGWTLAIPPPPAVE